MRQDFGVGFETFSALAGVMRDVIPSAFIRLPRIPLAASGKQPSDRDKARIGAIYDSNVSYRQGTINWRGAVGGPFSLAAHLFCS